MKRLRTTIVLAVLTGLPLLSEVVSAADLDVTVTKITHAIKPEGGDLEWRDGRWVAPESASVSGFIGFTVAVDGVSHAIQTDITGQSTQGGPTIYRCKNGDSFYEAGSPTGEVRAGTYESLIDPGMMVPLVTDADLRGLNIGTARVRINDPDELVRTDAGWDIWKVAVGRDIERLISDLKSSDSLERRVSAAERLGYLYHPLIAPALLEAASSPDGDLATAAKSAMAKLRVAIPTTSMSISVAQQRLIDLGYDPGPADGVWGIRTAKAVRAFQRKSGLKETGRLDAETIDRLVHAK